MECKRDKKDIKCIIKILFKSFVFFLMKKKVWNIIFCNYNYVKLKILINLV